jgi:hypothetical protein
LDILSVKHALLIDGIKANKNSSSGRNVKAIIIRATPTINKTINILSGVINISYCRSGFDLILSMRQRKYRDVAHKKHNILCAAERIEISK